MLQILKAAHSAAEVNALNTALSAFTRALKVDYAKFSETLLGRGDAKVRSKYISVYLSAFTDYKQVLLYGAWSHKGPVINSRMKEFWKGEFCCSSLLISYSACLHLLFNSGLQSRTTEMRRTCDDKSLLVVSQFCQRHKSFLPTDIHINLDPITLSLDDGTQSVRIAITPFQVFPYVRC